MDKPKGNEKERGQVQHKDKTTFYFAVNEVNRSSSQKKKVRFRGSTMWKEGFVALVFLS